MVYESTSIGCNVLELITEELNDTLVRYSKISGSSCVLK